MLYSGRLELLLVETRTKFEKKKHIDCQISMKICDLKKKLNMKFFQTVQKDFETLGICSEQSRINRKSIATSLIYGSGTCFSAIFLFWDANDFQEYTTNLYITTAFVVGFTYYLIMCFKMRKLFLLIEDMEKTLGKSKCIL